MLNQNWSKSSFGYPIHEDIRIPTSVAEMLRTENKRNLTGNSTEDQDTYDSIRN